MKVFGHQSYHKVRQVLVVAELTNQTVELVHTDAKALRSKEHLTRNPFGKMPVLETESGSVYESNTILRHLARASNNAASVYGATTQESTQVDQWLDVINNEVDVPLGVLYGAVLGWYPVDEATATRARQDLDKVLKVVDGHLKSATYLVGSQVTLADVVLACSLMQLFRFVLNEKARKALPNLSRWYQTVASTGPFTNTFGRLVLCEKELPLTFAKPAKAPASPKKEKKQQSPKKAAPKKEKKEEDEEIVQVKKDKNPLDLLPPSPFNFFDYKTLFVNAPNKADALDFFYKNFDANGYSIWFIDYIPAEGEGKVMFLTSNLMNGFLQRLDHFRKYCFAVHGVYGEEPNLQIKGCWIWRGTEHPMEMKDHCQYEYHTFKRCDLNNEADKKLFQDYMLNTEEDVSVVGGLKARIVKYFK